MCLTRMPVSQLRLQTRCPAVGFQAPASSAAVYNNIAKCPYMHMTNSLYILELFTALKAGSLNIKTVFNHRLILSFLNDWFDIYFKKFILGSFVPHSIPSNCANPLCGVTTELCCFTSSMSSFPTQSGPLKVTVRDTWAPALSHLRFLEGGCLVGVGWGACMCVCASAVCLLWKQGNYTFFSCFRCLGWIPGPASLEMEGMGSSVGPHSLHVGALTRNTEKNVDSVHWFHSTATGLS